MTLYPCPKPAKVVKARKPMRKVRKTPRRIRGVRNPALVAWIHTQSCHHCREMGFVQKKHTEASHMPFSRRFGDENNVWPLCVDCHRETPESWHHAKREWVEHYGRTGIATVSQFYSEKFYFERGGVVSAQETHKETQT